MRTRNFRDQNGPLAQTRIFSKKVTAVLMYLLSFLVVQNWKKIFRMDI